MNLNKDLKKLARNAQPLTWHEFAEFIDRGKQELDLKKSSDSYIAEHHACGTKGMWQLTDRLQFLISSLHSQICSHPSMQNPDTDFDHIRGQTAVAAQNLFHLCFMLYEMQLNRPRNLN